LKPAPIARDEEPLCLDDALRLLRHAGLTLPCRQDAGSARWLQAVIDGLCAIACRDPLTGLVNRRQLETALARELGRVARTGQPALMLMIDIDHFKQVNDTRGHAAGDLVLAAVARALQACIRPMDTLARSGGDEFAMILPGCPPASGSAIAERVRQQVRQCQVAIAPGQQAGVTVSIGGAFALQQADGSALLWMERADRQLYRAKSEGGDRACLETKQ